MKEILKRAAAGFLAVLLIVAVCPVTAFARGYVTDPLAHWENMAVEPSDIDYKNHVITIGNDTAELAWIAMVTNRHYNDKSGKYKVFNSGFSDWTIKLSHDLKLCYTSYGHYHYWDPIGISAGDPFCGVFDGCGHTLTDLDIDSGTTHCSKFYKDQYENSCTNCIGLFGAIGLGASVRNFNLTGKISDEADADTRSTVNIGSVVATMGAHTSLYNVTSSVDITTLHYSSKDEEDNRIHLAVGGLVGAALENTSYWPPNIENCAYTGSIDVHQRGKTKNDYALYLTAGQLVGYMGYHYMENASNDLKYGKVPKIINCYAYCEDFKVSNESAGNCKQEVLIVTGSAVGYNKCAGMNNVFSNNPGNASFTVSKPNSNFTEFATNSPEFFKSLGFIQDDKTTLTPISSSNVNKEMNFLPGLYKDDTALLDILNDYVTDSGNSNRGKDCAWVLDSKTGLPKLNFNNDGNNVTPVPVTKPTHTRVITIGGADVGQNGVPYDPAISVADGPSDKMQVFYNIQGSKDYQTTAPSTVGAYTVKVILPATSTDSRYYPEVVATKDFTICETGTPEIELTIKNHDAGTEDLPIQLNQNETLTVTLTSDQPINGTVEFYVDGTDIGTTGDLNNEKTTITADKMNSYQFTSFGKHTITAAFTSYDNYNKGNTKSIDINLRKSILPVADDAYAAVTDPPYTWNVTNDPAKPLVYSSSDETVATIDDFGKVTPNSMGETTLTAYFVGDDEYYPCTNTCKLTVDKKYIFVHANDVSILKGQSIPTPVITVTGLIEGDTMEDLEDHGFAMPTVDSVTQVDTNTVGDITAPVSVSGGDGGPKYRFNGYPDTVKVHISAVDVTAADYSADKDLTEWQSGAITITPQNGYTKISADNGTTWSDTLTLTQEGENQAVFCLKKDDDGTTTENTTVGYKIDNTAPNAAVSFASVSSGGWDKFWNTVTFGLFCKDKETVAVTASDNGSGVAKAEYLLSDTPFTNEADIAGTWTELPLSNDTGSFEIAANKESCVYVRVTDNVGHMSIINSDGIIVYTDAAQDTAEINFTRQSSEDKTAKVTLNGNTVKAILNGTNVIDSKNYSVAADGTITLKAAYLQSLKAGSYTLHIQYNPLGEEYKNGDAPAETTIALHVQQAEGIVSIANDISKTYDGSPVTVPKYTASGTGAVTIEYAKRGTSDYSAAAPSEPGNYTVRVTVAADGNYTEASATADFIIGNKAPVSNNPKTGDNSSPAPLFVLLFVSGGTLAASGILKKRKKTSD